MCSSVPGRLVQQSKIYVKYVLHIYIYFCEDFEQSQLADIEKYYCLMRHPKEPMESRGSWLQLNKLI